MNDIIRIAKDAIQGLQTVNDTAHKVLPDDIESIVKRHAKIAAATALIPITGLDMAAATANIWTMYVNINKEMGIKFSDNLLKSIGSAILSNVIQNVGFVLILSSLKLNPVTYWLSIPALATAVYALTITSGWVYLKAISNLSQFDNDLDLSVRAALKNHADIKRIYNKHK